jgi:hypothetical protein
MGVRHYLLHSEEFISKCMDPGGDSSISVRRFNSFNTSSASASVSTSSARRGIDA